MVENKVNLLDETNYDALEWLPRNAPYIEVDPESIEVIKTPTEFYEKLLVRCSKYKLKFLNFVLEITRKKFFGCEFWMN